MATTVPMIILSIHLFPHELHEYQRVIKLLNRSAEYINNIDIEIWPVLNMNPDVIEWEDESKKQSVIEAYLTTNKSSKITIAGDQTTTDPKFLGVNEHRSNTIERAHDDSGIIFLDTDLHFSETLLRDQITAREKISKFLDYYIITPHTIRLWDDTWNCITHPSYISESYSYYKNPPAQTIVSKNYGNFKIKPIVQFKWAGGWFNCISSKLLKKVGIPKSFAGYGPDDTFIMECCKVLRTKSFRVQQYVLTNQVVCEHRTTTRTPTHMKDRVPSFRESCNKVFVAELNNFIRKL